MYNFQLNVIHICGCLQSNYLNRIQHERTSSQKYRYWWRSSSVQRQHIRHRESQIGAENGRLFWLRSHTLCEQVKTTTNVCVSYTKDDATDTALCFSVWLDDFLCNFSTRLVYLSAYFLIRDEATRVFLLWHNWNDSHEYLLTIKAITVKHLHYRK